jgi:hypothetical protein
MSDMSTMPSDNTPTEEQLLAHQIGVRRHQLDIAHLTLKVIKNLQERAAVHDESKLDDQEAQVLARFPDQVRYGTLAYKTRLALMTAAIVRHYKDPRNRHHIEHHENGISGMSLLDLLEAVLDWWATAQRQPGGGIRRSIDLNQMRYGYTDELKAILLNTIDELESDQ